jgi:hypothetical protein
MGPGVAIETESFAGRARDLSCSSAIRWQVAASERATFALLAGAGGHFTTLQGTVAAGGASETQRFNLSLDAGALLDFKIVERLWLGVGTRTSYQTGYQRYLVNGQPVFETGPFAFEAGGRVGVVLF